VKDNYDGPPTTLIHRLSCNVLQASISLPGVWSAAALCITVLCFTTAASQPSGEIHVYTAWTM